MKNRVNLLFFFCWLILFSCTILATDQSVKNDFDGDGKTDIVVYREGAYTPSNPNPLNPSYWYILSSQTGQVIVKQWGRTSDYMDAADFDNDGKTDTAVFRWVADNLGPATPLEQWFKFSNNGNVAVGFQNSFGTMVSRNYFDDNRAEFGQFRTYFSGDPADPDTWCFNYGLQVTRWGIEAPRNQFITSFCSEEIAGTTGDYNNDGKTEVAGFIKNSQNPSASYFRVWNNPLFSGGYETPSQIVTLDIDIVIAGDGGDYDGDGKSDLGGWKIVNGNNILWRYKKSSDSSLMEVQFGLVGDKPVPGDYDGDGKTDIGVFRPSNSTWYILKSSNNSVLTVQFGLSTDVPVPIPGRATP